MRLCHVCAALVLLLGLAAVLSDLSEAAEYPYQTIPATLAGPLDDSTVISLQRGPCFGNCPEYTVTVWGSGRVEFDGRRFVCAKGRHTAHASPNEVRALVETMLEFGYLDLYWKPKSVPTLSNIVVSSLNHRGRVNRIEHFTGDLAAPRALTRFEDQIDTVAGTWRWLAEEEDDRRVCRLEDGETTEELLGPYRNK
jgi:hypothetical protein